MNFVRMMVVVVGALALGLSSPAEAGKPSQEEFFTILGEERTVDLEGLRALLQRVDVECTRIENPCPASDDLFSAIAGSLNVQNTPIQVVYLDENLDVRINKLFWRGELTPFILGAQTLGLVVVAEQPVELEARLINLYSQPGGFIAGAQDLFVSEGKRTIEARDASLASEEIRLDPMGSDGTARPLWAGTAQFHLETATSYRLSLIPVDPATDLPFHEIQAQFSNSKERSVDFGIGLGFTLDVDATVVDTLGGVILGDATYVNAYWMVTTYIRKPVLIKPIAGKGSRYRMSYGISFGLNLKFWEADEFNVGFNLGHVFGRHGFVAGVNWLDPDDAKSEANPFVAVVFTF